MASSQNYLKPKRDAVGAGQHLKHPGVLEVYVREGLKGRGIGHGPEYAVRTHDSAALCATRSFLRAKFRKASPARIAAGQTHSMSDEAGHGKERVAKVSITGGASIPVGHTRLNSSIPWVRLIADRTGIQLTVRVRWASKIFLLFGDFELTDGRISWAVGWTDLDRVVAGKRSVILHPRGRRSCQFIATRKGAVASLVQVVEAQGISVDRVRSTYFRRLH